MVKKSWGLICFLALFFLASGAGEASSKYRYIVKTKPLRMDNGFLYVQVRENLGVGYCDVDYSYDGLLKLALDSSNITYKRYRKTRNWCPSNKRSEITRKVKFDSSAEFNLKKNPSDFSTGDVREDFYVNARNDLIVESGISEIKAKLMGEAEIRKMLANYPSGHFNFEVTQFKKLKVRKVFLKSDYFLINVLLKGHKNGLLKYSAYLPVPVDGVKQLFPKGHYGTGWESEYGWENIGVFTDPEAKIRGFNFFGEKDSLVTVNRNGVVRLQSLDGQKNMTLFEEQQKIRDRDFSATGEFLAVGSSEGKITVWNLRQKEKVWEFQVKNQLSRIKFSRSGNFLVIKNNQDTYSIWNVSEQKIAGKISLSVPGVKSIAFSSENGKLAVGNIFGQVYIGKINSPDYKKILNTYPVKPHGSSYFWIHSVEFSPQNNLLAAAAGRRLVTWDLQSKKQKNLITRRHSEKVTDISFFPEGNLLAVVKGGRLLIWNFERGGLTTELPVASPKKVKFSPTGKYLAVKFQAGGISIWELPEAFKIRFKYFRSSSGKKETGKRKLEQLIADSRRKIRLLGVELGEYHSESDTPYFDIYYQDRVRCWLGVRLQRLNYRKKKDYKSSNGVIVESVINNSPATRAGLKTGDLIVKIGDEKIKSIRQLQKVVLSQPVGKKREIAVEREKRVRQLEMIFTGAPKQSLAEIKKYYGSDLPPVKYKLRVCSDHAGKFKRRFDQMKKAGWIQLKTDGSWEFINKTIYDPKTGRKYPFGKQQEIH